MKYLNALLLFTLLFACCKEEEEQETLPQLTTPTYNFEELGRNSIDQNRLCVAETLSKLLEKEAFRIYLQQQSVNEEENWNNEFLLITHFQEEIFDGLTLAEHIN